MDNIVSQQELTFAGVSAQEQTMQANNASTVQEEQLHRHFFHTSRSKIKTANRASAQDILTAQLYMKAAFPAMKVALESDPSQAKRFKNFNGIVQFTVDDDVNPLACHIVFRDEINAENSEDGKRFKVYQGKYDGDAQIIDMHFKSVKSLLGVFKGKKITDMLGIVKPLLSNIFKKGTLRFLFLMLSLTKTMPKFLPTEKQPLEQYLKVKMSLYLITSALSSANKLGWKEMTSWTAKQTDRIYQFKVGATLDGNGNEIYPPIAAYLRVKAGNTKAGRGEYSRRRPFVLFDFPNPDGCLAVLTKRYEFVEACEKGCVTVIGSGDSYAVQFNDIMTKAQNMLID